MSDAAQMARLRVARETGALPRDLAEWAIQRIAELSPDAERQALRDDLLREAGRILGGSAWSRATTIAAELEAMHRRHTEPTDVRRLLAEALELDPTCPRSVRHLFRVIVG